MVDVTSYHHWVYLDFPTRTTTTHEIPHALSGTWDGKSAISYQHVTWPSTYRTDSIIHTDPMPTPHQWTIALHHYDVATNNGAAVVTNYRSLDALPREGAAREALLAQTFSPDEWTTHQSYYDLTGIYQYYIGYQHAAFNPVLSSWMDMDVKILHHATPSLAQSICSACKMGLWLPFTFPRTSTLRDKKAL